MCPLFLPSRLSLPPNQAQPQAQPQTQPQTQAQAEAQAQARILVQLKGVSERPRPSKEP